MCEIADFDDLDGVHGATSKVRRAAEEWIATHPEAMDLFEKLALQAAARGRKFGISLLTERIRWEYQIERSDDEFKINNNHSAYIARELLKRHPFLAPLMATRQTISDITAD